MTSLVALVVAWLGFSTVAYRYHRQHGMPLEVLERRLAASSYVTVAGRPSGKGTALSSGGR
jgi:hypothetical protein